MCIVSSSSKSNSYDEKKKYCLLFCNCFKSDSYDENKRFVFVVVCSVFCLVFSKLNCYKLEDTVKRGFYGLLFFGHSSLKVMKGQTGSQYNAVYDKPLPCTVYDN